MTEPTQEVKTSCNYAVDQQVSVNAFIDVDINGENVKFQITSRYNSTPEKIVKTTKAAIEAFAQIRAEYPRPANVVKSTNSAPSDDGEKKKFEVRPVPAAELPEGLPEGGEYFKDEFDYFEITPQADDKATVTFYKDNLKFPIGARINKWKNENVKVALSSLGEFDVTKAQKPRVPGTQYWTKGSEYIIASGAHQGEKSHYKDLRLIVPSF